MRIRLIYILCLLVIMGCTHDDTDADSETVAVTFSVAGINVSSGTRTDTDEPIPTGTTLEVVAYAAGTTTSAVAVKTYTVNSSGVLVANNTPMTLAAGSYDFYIYTTKSGVSRTDLVVSSIPHGMDFFAGSNLTREPITGTSQVVVFEPLTRMCSKLDFSISCESGKTFTMRSITINHVASGTTATYTLGGSMVVPTASDTDTYTLFSNSNTGDFTGNGTGTVTTSETIILPVTVNTGYKLTFNVTIDNVDAVFTATLTNPTPAFEGGKHYKYNVTLSDKIEIELDVAGWSTGDIDITIIEPYTLSVSQGEFTFTGAARDASSTDNILTVTTKDCPEKWTVGKIVDAATGIDIKMDPGGWLKVIKEDGSDFTEGGTADGTTKLQLILDANSTSEPRTGYIHLCMRKLTYIVKVTQKQ